MHQCTPQELSLVLLAFRSVGTAFPEHSEKFDSELLNDIFSSFPKLKAPIETLLTAIDVKKAASGKIEDMWTDEEKFPALDEYRMVCKSLITFLMLLTHGF